MFAKTLRAMATAALLLAGVALLASGCGPKNVTIQMNGSTSVQPLADELIKVYMQKNPHVKITYAGTGSGSGIKAAQEGTHDIGTSSRELKPEEKTVKEFKIAVDGIAIVVHPSNPVSGLSVEQVKKIFAGEITNWKDVGGPDAPITVVTREDGSGTRGAFTEIVMHETPIKADAVVQTSTGAVITAVASDQNAIGYVSLGSVNNTVKALPINGVAPSVETVKSGEYKIQRPFLFLTKEEPKGEVKKFIDFVLSAEGQQIVKEQGFVPVK